MKRFFLPVLLLIFVLMFWEYYVDVHAIPKFVLPAPSGIFSTLGSEFISLGSSAMATLHITLIALGLATVSGILFALLFSISRTFEAALYPFAVILQVTPVIAIAPLIIIWVGIDNMDRAQIIIAWLVSFFPILANMSAGLRAADPNLQDLFTLYGANRWQRFRWLLWPTATPYLLASLKVSGGLALIGGVVAEFVAGSGTSAGLAWRIIEAGNRLQIEKMFAGLLLLALIGIIIFYGFTALERSLMKHKH